MHAHLARNMSQHLVTVLELDLEHGVGKRLDDRSLKFNCILFCHL